VQTAAEEVALVCRARRALLLRVHRHKLRPDDLEDAYSQATYELLVFVRRGGRFANRRQLAAAIETRFLSRVSDRRRALSGRSPAQALLEHAAAIDSEEARRVPAREGWCDPERVVLLRHELREIGAQMRRLTADQRLVIGAQALSVDRAEFMAAHRWSGEKYRKVAQRGRARLRELTVVPPSWAASDE
jgi:hypothetical protein